MPASNCWALRTGRSTSSRCTERSTTQPETGSRAVVASTAVPVPSTCRATPSASSEARFASGGWAAAGGKTKRLAPSLATRYASPVWVPNAESASNWKRRVAGSTTRVTTTPGISSDSWRSSTSTSSPRPRTCQVKTPFEAEGSAAIASSRSGGMSPARSVCSALAATRPRYWCALRSDSIHARAFSPSSSPLAQRDNEPLEPRARASAARSSAHKLTAAAWLRATLVSRDSHRSIGLRLFSPAQPEDARAHQHRGAHEERPSCAQETGVCLGGGDRAVHSSPSS